MYTGELFRCSAYGLALIGKFIQTPGSSRPSALPMPGFPERGTLPAENDKMVRHEIKRSGLGTLNTAAYSPDGKSIAFGGSLGIWLLTNDLKPIVHLSGSAFQVTALA